MTTTTSPRHDSGSHARSDATPLVRVVDDDVLVRESLELLIRSAGWRAETFGCAMEFLALPQTPGPACLVLDVSLPDINGLDLQQRLVAQGNNVPIVMVSGSVDVPTTVRAMKAGAFDFVTKPVDGESLLASVAHAIERSRAALQKEEKMRVLQEHHASLTRREREVMERVVVGRLNKQVAFELDISEGRVKVHRRRLMRKMHAPSLPALVNMAARLGIAT
jgi:FixJ family two-component response regulator